MDGFQQIVTALTADRHMHTDFCLWVTFDVLWAHQPDDDVAAELLCNGCNLAMAVM